MPHRKHSRIPRGSAPGGGAFPIADSGKIRLEVVLKCDSMGSMEAVSAVLANLKLPETEVRVIHAGVGTISRQDLLMALTGSKLVIGFNVGVAPKLEQWIKEQGIEVRLYKVIYTLVDDLKKIARDIVPAETEEKVTGTCKVIAVFKSSKGIVLGCEVQEGSVQVGKNFRIVTAMGPAHSSRIESLQVEKQPVKEARQGQQVGVKVGAYSGAKVGDFIEVFETIAPKRRTWSPEGKIVHLESP